MIALAAAAALCGPAAGGSDRAIALGGGSTGFAELGLIYAAMVKEKSDFKPEEFLA